MFDVTVSTVDAFQGAEREIIFLSCTTTNSDTNSGTKLFSFFIKLIVLDAVFVLLKRFSEF